MKRKALTVLVHFYDILEICYFNYDCIIFLMFYNSTFIRKNVIFLGIESKIFPAIFLPSSVRFEMTYISCHIHSKNDTKKVFLQSLVHMVSSMKIIKQFWSQICNKVTCFLLHSNSSTFCIFHFLSQIYL